MDNCIVIIELKYKQQESLATSNTTYTKQAK